MLKKYAQLNNKVFAFLASLSEKELNDLADGKVAIGLIGQELSSTQKVATVAESSIETPIEPKEKIDDKKGKDFHEVYELLKTVNSQEEAINYFEQMDLPKKDLLEICAHYELKSVKSLTKGAITQKIIEFTVGLRLRSKGIRGTDLS